MFFTRNKAIRFMLVALVFLAPYIVKAVYIPSVRDTSVPPVEMHIDTTNFDGQAPIYASGDYEYYYNNDTTVISIKDLRNGYVWKTGLDLLSAPEVAEQCTAIEKLYEEQLSDLSLSNFGNWQFEQGNTGSSAKVAVLEGENGELKASTQGLNDSHAEDEFNMSYSGITLENGKQYRLSFDARSIRDKTIGIKIGTFSGGVFTEIYSDTFLTSKNDSVNLDYEFDFTMSEATTSEAVMIFELGYFAIDAAAVNTLSVFDNFLLEETDGTDVIADTNVLVQGDFIVADENLDVKAQDVIDGCISKEKGLNAESFLPWANSLVTIEFYRNLLQGGKILESQRTSSTSNYLAQSDYEMMATDDPSHRVFVNTFTFKDATKPASCVTGYIAINNECKSIDFNVSCADGQTGVEGVCYDADPVCEVGLKPLDGECVEAEADDIVTLEIMVHVYLEETGLRFEVKNEEITGNGRFGLISISIAPWMGAVGGKEELYNIETGDYEGPFDKEITPGYSFVPDGSGSLIRYTNQTVELDQYASRVYGMNFTQEENHWLFGEEYIPLKDATMPLYGMVHGNNQAAYLAYATKGDEYMTIFSTPDEKFNAFYSFTYAAFDYNNTYLQVYNQQGWGYLDIYDKLNDFDIELNFRFLSGDGSTDGYSADYVGMAHLYRDILIENGDLHPVEYTYDDVPLRLDFFMSDAEKAVFGFSNAVTTDYSGVRSILNDVLDSGITNINSGLLGWNDGGVTLGDASKVDFARNIGTKRQFDSLINDFDDKGVDISFAQDYFLFNEEIMNSRRNAAKHTNNWYSRIDTFNYPIDRFFFARPTKSIEWLLDQTDVFDDLGVSSYTIMGITDNLISDYTDDDNRIDSLNIILNGFDDLNDKKLINAYQPNSYLWKYTDRYLQMPVFSSQHLIETDTVPFLQLVLQGTMEMYAPYSNFSFYTDSDVLRMIDYNVYPSFVLSKEASHLLSDTNSRNFYSTQYTLYEDVIQSIYGKVNTALSPVIGAEWLDREVVQNGLIVNTYSNGVQVVINYTDDAIDYMGTTVEAVSFQVIGG